MDITIRQINPMRLAVLVNRESPINFREVWGKLRPTVKTQGLDRPGALFASVFQVSALTLPMKMDWYAAALVLEEGQTVATPLEEQRIDSGAFVTSVYEGPYEGIGQAWGAFVESLKAAGHQPDMSRACLEIYLDDGSGTPPKAPRTELFVPLRATSSSGASPST